MVHYSRTYRAPEWRNWQTQWTQNPPLATTCEFESRLGHHAFEEGPGCGALSFGAELARARGASGGHACGMSVAERGEGVSPKPGDLPRKSPSSLASGTMHLRRVPVAGPFLLVPNSRERAERQADMPVACP